MAVAALKASEYRARPPCGRVAKNRIVELADAGRFDRVGVRASGRPPSCHVLDGLAYPSVCRRSVFERVRHIGYAGVSSWLSLSSEARACVTLTIFAEAARGTGPEPTSAFHAVASIYSDGPAPVDDRPMGRWELDHGLMIRIGIGALSRILV